MLFSESDEYLVVTTIYFSFTKRLRFIFEWGWIAFLEMELRKIWLKYFYMLSLSNIQRLNYLYAFCDACYITFNFIFSFIWSNLSWLFFLFLFFCVFFVLPAKKKIFIWSIVILCEVLWMHINLIFGSIFLSWS